MYAKVPAIGCSRCCPRCCLANAVDGVEVLYHGKVYRPAPESKVTNLTVNMRFPTRALHHVAVKLRHVTDERGESVKYQKFYIVG